MSVSKGIISMKHAQQAEFIERTRCINCSSAHLSELSRGSYRHDPLAGFLTADPWGENPIPFLQTAIWILAKCNDCTQVFQKRILNEEWNERRFSKWMSADAIRLFEEKLGPAFPRKFSSSVKHVSHVLRIEKLTRDIRNQSEAVRLLDFGCGFGDFLEVCNHFGFEASGVDRSSARREVAAVNIMPDLPEDSELKYHAVTLFEVLEHLDHPSAALATLAKYVMQDGLLVLETPDCSGVTDIRSHDDYLKVHPLEHINAFTHDTLKSIAERNGFRLISRGAAHVATDNVGLAKTIAKEVFGRGEYSTQLYFRKT